MVRKVLLGNGRKLEGQRRRANGARGAEEKTMTAITTTQGVTLEDLMDYVDRELNLADIEAQEIYASLKRLAAIDAVKKPEPVAYLQTVSNPGEPERTLLSINCDSSLHRQLKTGGTYTRKPLHTHPPAQRDGAAVAELKNIVNAKRFDVDVFEDDTQFADWVQSRARHILSAEPAAKDRTKDLENIALELKARIKNAVHLLDAGATKEQVRCHLSSPSPNPTQPTK